MGGLSLALVLCTALTALAQSPFQSIPGGVSDTLRFQAPLGDFSASDISGRPWRSEDLLGKITVVSIWAVWCVPCRKELPAVQEFYAGAKAHDKIQVLTFSLDDDPRVVRSYMNEKGYTFPVIVDKDQEQKLFPMEGPIPQTWVIDSQGRRSERFRSWTMGRIVLEVENLAKSAGGHSSSPEPEE